MPILSGRTVLTGSAVLAYSLVFGLYAIDDPIAVCAYLDSGSSAVLTGSTVLAVLAVSSDSLVFGLNAVDYPIAVCAYLDSGSCTVSSVCTVLTGSAILTVLAVSAVLAYSLIFGLYAIDDPIAVGAYLDCGSYTVLAVLTGSTVLTGSAILTGGAVVTILSLYNAKRGPGLSLVIGNENLTVFKLKFGGYTVRSVPAGSAVFATGCKGQCNSYGKKHHEQKSHNLHI